MSGNFDHQVWLLLQNDRFIKWVNSPDRNTTVYWNDWMKQHPDQQDIIFKARQIVLDLARAQTPPDADDLAALIWNSIQKDIDITEGIDIQAKSLMQVTFAPTRPSRYRYLAAAAVTGLLLLGVGIYYHHISSTKLPARSIAGTSVNQELKRTNQTAGTQVLYLMDGSKVILEPGSSIRQTLFFQKDKREIYLEGNAFFDVTRDPARPFYVYTKDIVMQVLGTSFKVCTDNHNGDVTVVIKTGKVSVYKKSGKPAGQLILTSNEKVIYRARTSDLVSATLSAIETLSNQPPVSHAFDFNFEERPVGEIFDVLISAYGVPIYYEKKSLSKCLITTSLGEVPFEEKLKVICAAIGATYQIKDNGVFITGGSCNSQ